MLALSAAILSLPLFACIALWVVLDSKGGAFFVQERPGLHGKLFKLYKFRSMQKAGNKEPFKLTTENDARVTRAGKWLRQLHLDELPQLINVLRGDMSLVGPRPIPAELYTSCKEEIDHYDLRHCIKPGITGFSQVWLGYTNTMQGEALKWKYDMYYIKYLSPGFDAQLLWQTLFFHQKQKAVHIPRVFRRVLDQLESPAYSFAKQPDQWFSAKSISKAS